MAIDYEKLRKKIEDEKKTYSNEGNMGSKTVYDGKDYKDVGHINKYQKKETDARNRFAADRAELNTHIKDGRLRNILYSAANSARGGYASTIATKQARWESKNSDKPYKTYLDNPMLAGRDENGDVWTHESRTRRFEGMMDSADRRLEISNAQLESAKQGLGAVGQFGVDAAQQGLLLGSDMVLNSLGALVGLPGLGLAAMGGRAYGQAANELRQEGASLDQQEAYGTLSASVEVLTEKLFQGASLLRSTYGKGVISEKMISDYASRLGKNLAKTELGAKIAEGAIKAGMAAQGEGVEEAIATALNPLIRMASGQEYQGEYTDKEFYKQMGRDYLLGGTMGFVLGGGSAVIDNYKGGKLTDEQVEEFVEVASQMDEDSEAYQAAQNVKEDMANGKVVTDAQKIDLARATQAEYAKAREGTSTYTTNDLARQIGVNLESQEDVELAGNAIGSELTAVSRMVQDSFDSFTNVEEGEQTKSTEISEEASMLARTLRGLTVNDGQAQIAQLMPGNTAARETFKAITGIELDETNAGTRQQVMQYMQTAKVDLANTIGAKMDEEFDRTYSDNLSVTDTAQSYGEHGRRGFSKAISEVYSSVKDNDMSQRDKRDHVFTHQRAYEAYYSAGADASVDTRDEMLARLDEAFKDSAVPVELRHGAFLAGTNDSDANRAKAEAKRNNQKKDNNPKLKRNDPDRGKVKNHLSKQVYSKEKLDGLKAFAEIFNTKIELVDELEGNKDGNASYSRGVIQISAKKSKNPLINAASHEFTHQLRDMAPVEYQEYQDYVVAEYSRQNPELWNNMVDEKIKLYARNGQKLSRDEAIEEILADSAERFFRSAEDIQALSKHSTGLAARFKEFLDKLVNGLRALLSDKVIHYGDFYDELGIFEQARDLYAKAVETTINYSGGVANLSDGTSWSVPTEKNAEVKGAFARDNGGSKHSDGMAKAGTVLASLDNLPVDVTSVLSEENLNRAKNGGKVKVSGRDLRDAWMNQNGKAEQADRVDGFMDNLEEFFDDMSMTFEYVDFGHAKTATVKYTQDAEGNPQTMTASAMVANDEYEINFDFSTICKKREAMAEVVEKLASMPGHHGTMYDEVTLDADGIATINAILSKHGMETACPICFVETKRANLQSQAGDIVDAWNSGLPEDAPYFDADEYMNNYDQDKINKIFQSFYDKGGAKGNRDHKLSSLAKEFGFRLKTSDYVTPKGEEALKGIVGYARQKSGTPTQYNLFTYLKGTLGQTAGKETVSFTPYNSEVAMYPSKINGQPLQDFLLDIAGARIQSFSDFQIENTYDYCQLIADLSARDLTAHAYTKEIIFAKLFGLTGIKINMSGVCDIDTTLDDYDKTTKLRKYAGLKVVGKDKNGDPIFDYNQSDQSIDLEEAYELQDKEGYDKNCGIIMVGLGDEHIRKMLLDKRIKYIIPYHKSSLPSLKRYGKANKTTAAEQELYGQGLISKRDLKGAKDYTSYQNTMAVTSAQKNGKGIDLDLASELKKRNGDVVATMQWLNGQIESGKLKLETSKSPGAHGALAPETFNVYTDTERGLAATKDPVKTSMEYVKACLEHNRLPVFYTFLTSQEYADNYYKMVFDFSLYDSNGKYAEQTPVRNNYPGMNVEEGQIDLTENEGSFGQILKSGMSERNDTQGHRQAVMGDVMQEVVQALPRKYSITEDSEGNTLTESQSEYFKNSEAVDENGNLAVVFHSTENGGFTIFDPQYSDDGRSLFFTDGFNMSQSYAKFGDRNIVENLDEVQNEEATTTKLLSELTSKNPDSINSMKDLDDYIGSLGIVYRLNGINAITYVNGEEERYAPLWEIMNSLDNGKKTTLEFREGETVLIRASGSTEAELIDSFKRRIMGKSIEAKNIGAKHGYYKAYLNLTKPLVIDAEGHNWNEIPFHDDRAKVTYKAETKKMSRGLLVTVWKNGKIVLNEEATDAEDAMDIIDNYTSDDPDASREVQRNLGDEASTNGSTEMVSEPNAYVNTRYISEFAQNNGYDGVIIRNVTDYGEHADPEETWESNTVYIAFDSNQVKATNNLNPTEDPDIRYSLASDEDYFKAIESGDIDSVRKMVEAKAKVMGFDNAVPEQVLSYKTRTTKPPKKVIDVYKVFTVDENGRPSALFVSGVDNLPQNVWIEAQDTWHFQAKNGNWYVPSTINPNSDATNKTGTTVEIPDEETRQELIKRGYLSKGSKAKSVVALAYRPGWHAGDLPFFPQGGKQVNHPDMGQYYNPDLPSTNYKQIHRYNQVVFRCELAFDQDYTRFKTNEDGGVTFFDVDENGNHFMPMDGAYKFSTNPMAHAQDIGSWYISGALRIKEALTEEECNRILAEHGKLPQEWQAYQDEEELKGIKRDVRESGKVVTGYYKNGRPKTGFESKEAEEANKKLVDQAEKDYQNRIAPMSLEALGYTGEQFDAARKTLAPITYDDNGEIIPLSERFNADVDDIRYSLSDEAYVTESSLKAEQAKNRRLEKRLDKGLAKERLKLKKDKAIAREKRKHREYKANQKEKKERREVLGKIKKRYENLYKTLSNPTDAKHLPDGFDKAVADFLAPFNFETDRSKPDSKSAQERAQRYFNVADLADELEKAAEDNGSTLIVDPAQVAIAKRVNKVIQNKRLADLTLEELQDVYKLMRLIDTVISKANKSFTDGVTASINERAQQAIQETRERGKVYKKGKAGDMLNQYLTSNTKPRDFFRVLTKDGGALYEAYMGMRRAFNRHIDNMTDFRNAWDKAVHYKQVKEWRKQSTKFKLESGKEIRLTVPQIMALYELNKRDQARSHIYGVGIVATDEELSRKAKKEDKGSKKENREAFVNKRVMVTVKDVENICRTLTDEQRKVANNLQRIMNTMGSEWGNQASLTMYNYKKFTEKDYFPISVLNTWLDEKGGVSQAQRIRTLGMTKQVQPQANNPLVLDDIFSVTIDHMNKMSMYTMTPELTDFERIWNYKNKEEGVSLREEFEATYGKNASAYVRNLMDNVNGYFAKDENIAIFDKMLSMFKRAKVGASLRVLVQQPTAILRAGAYINPAYITAGMSQPNFRKARDEMFKYSQIARWKSWGFYETDTAKSMESIIENKRELADLTMGAYGVADNMAWVAMWNAVKIEVGKQNPKIAKGSPEFFEKVTERFEEVVDHTQVVDSVFHRSQLMRSKNVLIKGATAFMSEPTTTVNMLQTELLLAHQEAQAGEKSAAAKRVSRVIATIVATGMATSIVAGAVDAMRHSWTGGDDDDEEKSFLQLGLEATDVDALIRLSDLLSKRRHHEADENMTFLDRWVAHSKKNMPGNIDPLEMMPFVKDIFSIMDGYSVERADVSLITNVWDSVEKLKKYLNGNSSYSMPYIINDMLGSVGEFAGVPYKNFSKDVIGALRTGAEVAGHGDYANYLYNSTMYSQKSFNVESEINSWLNAKRRGNNVDADKIRKSMMTKNGMSEADFNKVVQKMATDGLKDAIISGDIETVKNARATLTQAGWSREDVNKVIKDKYATTFKETLKTYDANSIRQIANRMASEGFTKDDIKTMVKNNYASAYKDAYIKGDRSTISMIEKAAKSVGLSNKEMGTITADVDKELWKLDLIDAKKSGDTAEYNRLMSQAGKFYKNASANEIYRYVFTQTNEKQLRKEYGR